MRDHPRRAMKGALVVVSLIASSLLGEVVLQIAYRVRNGAWLLFGGGSFEVGFAAPVSDRRQYALRPGYAEPSLHIDAQGFRAPPSSVVPPGSRVIAVVGDSVPFGKFASDEDSYPAMLDRELVERGVSLRALNAGVPSYNLRQSFDRLHVDVEPRFSVAAVVVQAANDMSLLTQYRERWTPDRTWAPVRYHWLGPLDRVGWVRFLSAAGAVTEAHLSYTPDAMLAAERATLDRELGALVARKIPVLLLPIDLLPYSDGDVAKNAKLALWARWSALASVWREISDRFNAELAAAASRWPGARYVDIRHRMDPYRPVAYLDVIHYSRAGASHVCDWLLEELAAAHVIEPVTDAELMAKASTPSTPATTSPLRNPRATSPAPSSRDASCAAMTSGW